MRRRSVTARSVEHYAACPLCPRPVGKPRHAADRALGRMGESAMPGSTGAAPGRRRVLGVPVDAATTGDFVRIVEEWVDAAGPPRVAVPVNAHLLMLARDSSELAAVLDASELNYVDGTSVLWAARLLGHRVP